MVEKAGMAALHAIVRGRVHGVFFRAFVESRVEELNLTGYVRNLPDGTVEVWVEGDRARLEKLVAYLKTGPPASRVEEVAVVWEQYTGGFSRFRITY